MGKTVQYILLTILLLISLTHAKGVYAETTLQEAQQRINEAKIAIYDAYNICVEAEEAGADVSSLVGKLNNAIDLLTEAKAFLSEGDYTNAKIKATLAKSEANQVKIVAQDLKSQALFRKWLESIIIPIGATLLLVIIAIFMYKGWTWYVKKREAEILKMKIRLPEDKEEETE